MRYHALACDYDGTIAHHGLVDAPTLAALERLRLSGRRLVLVTGRVLEDLASVFPRLDLFDRAVVENGAVVYDPATGEARTLADPPPMTFAADLERRGVHPLSVGRVIVATWEPHEAAVLEAIRDSGLELQMIFNKGAVMVLPSGINKAAGLRRALDDLGLSPHNVAAVGDAENDHAFFSACECAVAVANAVPRLKERADWVTVGDHGAGVRELVQELVDDDLRRLGGTLERHMFALGTDAAGAPLRLPPYSAPVMVAGTSGGGKSTLAASLLEQMAERGYQFCIIDPEGDYGALAGATPVGDAKRAPGIAEILEVLSQPGHSAVANLLGVPLSDRPAFFIGMATRLMEMRAKTGRPHWVVIDEAHHMLPQSLDLSGLALPADLYGILLLTVDPRSVSAALLRTVGTAIAIGSTPRETLAALALAAGFEAPSVDPTPLAPGEGVAWLRQARPGQPPVRLKLHAPRAERQRHVRKYAAGELGPDSSFYFRGPDGKLNLRAQNLQLFLQLAEGVDEQTWTFHLGQGDYARWFRERIKDEDLAQEAEAIERDRRLSAAESRQRIKEAVERRYTAPG
jgi:hydroxymethylpyrimidine pyrophosphatase-like HAD family hydrolase